MIASGMAAEVADAMAELGTLAPKGYLAGIEDSIEKTLGHPARDFETFIAENAQTFS
ncbi:hypothetical protein [Profundibacter sp.]